MSKYIKVKEKTELHIPVDLSATGKAFYALVDKVDELFAPKVEEVKKKALVWRDKMDADTKAGSSH